MSPERYKVDLLQLISRLLNLSYITRINLATLLQVEKNARVISPVSKYDGRMYHGMFYDEILWKPN